MQDRVLLSLLRFAIAQTLFILWSGSTYQTFYKIRRLSVVLRICKSFTIILISPYSVYVVSELLCTVTAANHVPLVAHVICFPCLSEYRHQPIPALHIPCTAWNITFISMICHFRSCPRLFLHNTCRTSDGSAGGWPRTWACMHLLWA